MAKVGRPTNEEIKKRELSKQGETSQQEQNISPYSLEATSERWNKVFSSGKYNGCDYLIAMQNSLGNNPFVQSQRLKLLKTQPNLADRDTLENALKDPSNNEITLRSASWALSSANYPLYRMMKLDSDVLLYKTYVYPKYVSKGDMKTPRFESDSKIVHMWMDKLKPEYTFRRIAFEVSREGKRAYYYRQNIVSTTGKESVDYVELQDLPSDWIKITAKSNNSYFKVSFNFAYFWTPGTSVDQFDPIFREYYKELMGCTVKTTNGYGIDVSKVPNDDKTLVEFAGGSWYFWKELDGDKAFTFSTDESHVWQVPSTMSLFLSASDLQAYSFLQQQLLSNPLNSMMVGEIPFHEAGSNKSGNYTDDMRLSEGVVDGFSSVYNAIAPAGSGLFVAPFQKMKLEHFPEVPNASGIVLRSLEQLVASSGLTGVLATGERQSVASIKGTQQLVARSADFMYQQFMNFMNICMENHLDLKYTWRSKIFGDVFSKKDEIAELEKGLSMGMVALLPDYMAMHDKTIEDVRCQSDWIDSLKLYDKMKPIVSGFQSSDKGDKNGRQKIDNPDNDSTEASQSAGTNTADMKTFSLDENVCSICGTSFDNSEYSPFCSEICRQEWLENQEIEEGDINV